MIQKESEGGRDVWKAPSVTSQPGPCASQVPGHLLHGGFLVTYSGGQVQSNEWSLHLAAPALPSDEGQLTYHQLSLPTVGNQRAQACVWRAWMGNLLHVVCTGPKPTRDSKIRPWTAERGFQNHRARAPCSCLESLYHKRLPWPAVCPLGGVLPEPHRWWPLKVHVPSGDTVVSMMSPASSLELSSLMGRTQLPQEGSWPPLFRR